MADNEVATCVDGHQAQNSEVATTVAAHQAQNSEVATTVAAHQAQNERHRGPLDLGDSNTMASLSDTAGGDVAVSSSNEVVPNTFFGQIWNYLLLIVIVFMCIIGLIIFLAILIALPGGPIAAIVIGAKNRRSCPAQPFIPIYLIVWGSSAITDILLIFLQNSNSKAKESKIIKLLQMVLCPFTTAWCIGGSVIVYNIKNFSSDPEAGNFCDSILYSFAFWMPISCLILFGMLCVCVYLIAFREKKFIVILRQPRRSLGQP